MTPEIAMIEYSQIEMNLYSWLFHLTIKNKSLTDGN